jgi:hypothetical protein
MEEFAQKPSAWLARQGKKISLKSKKPIRYINSHPCTCERFSQRPRRVLSKPSRSNCRKTPADFFNLRGFWSQRDASSRELPCGRLRTDHSLPKTVFLPVMDDASFKTETLGDVIDQIERMRDELLAIQNVLEKWEVAKPFGEQDAAGIKKTEDG